MRSSFLIAALFAVTCTASAIEVSQEAPDFTLKSMDGENFRLHEHRGKVILLNFWASWCGPCRQEMPILSRIHERYADTGFMVLGVNIDKKEKKARQIAEKVNVRFPLLLDQKNEISEQYEVSSMPYTVLIDRDGNINYIHKGYKPGDEAQYVNKLRKLLRTPAKKG